MAVSGSYNFTANRDEIIKGALRLNNAIASGETPTAAEIVDCAEALNMMIKHWQAEGIGLWLIQEITLLLEYEAYSYALGPSGDHASLTVVKTELAAAGAAAAGTITVDSDTGISNADAIGIELDDKTLQWTTVNGGPAADVITLTVALTGAAAVDNHVYAYTTKIQRPLEVIEARRVDSEGNDTPIGPPISRDEYMSLTNKTQIGIENQVYYDPQTTNGVLKVWQASGDVQRMLRMSVKYPVQDFDTAADNADFPVEWLRTLKFNLAVEIAPEFGKEPSSTVKRIADETKEQVQGFDREQTSIFFQPDLGQ